MNTQEANFQEEMKVEVNDEFLLNYKNKAKEPTEQDITENSSQFDEKQIRYEYFHSESIKLEEMDIKIEDEEGEQSNTKYSGSEPCELPKPIYKCRYCQIGLVLEEYKKSHTIRCSILEEENTSEDGTYESDCQDILNSGCVVQEKIDSNMEDEEKDQCNNKLLATESNKSPHPTSKGVNLNDFTLLSVNNRPTFKCLKCGYQAHPERFMSAHILCHLSNIFQCLHCPYKSNNKKLLTQHKPVHMPKEEAELHKCSICSFTSKWKCALNEHLLIHKNPDEITWYQCQECPYKTKRKRDLQTQHVWVHRRDLPKHKCTLCPNKFTTKDRLETHLKRVHSPKDIPPISTTHELEYEWFSCHLCSYKTITKHSLNSHTLVHKSSSEIRWFRCSKCSFKTKHKGALPRHKLKHSSEAKEFASWFCCYVCSFRTPYKQSLARHIRAVHRDADGRICSDGLAAIV